MIYLTKKDLRFYDEIEREYELLILNGYLGILYRGIELRKEGVPDPDERMFLIASTTDDGVDVLYKVVIDYTNLSDRNKSVLLAIAHEAGIHHARCFVNKAVFVSYYEGEEEFELEPFDWSNLLLGEFNIEYRIPISSLPYEPKEMK